MASLIVDEMHAEQPSQEIISLLYDLSDSVSRYLQGAYLLVEESYASHNIVPLLNDLSGTLYESAGGLPHSGRDECLKQLYFNLNLQVAYLIYDKMLADQLYLDTVPLINDLSGALLAGICRWPISSMTKCLLISYIWIQSL